MRMKKFLTFLLTLAMVVSMLPATAFAANNTATTMRLAKTQGTVAVTNATGKQVKQTGNMKLYNGYKIKTGAKSYAWISLDNTKAAKLDANSVVSVQKSGQKLTLYLSSGNLFFNVKDPLKSGESFHIKTSTMTTGIRGTSGCVRVINDRVTEVHLLTGQVEIYTENPALHISKTAVLKAGQKATSLIADEAMAAMGEQAGIIIEQLTHEEVCGNCSKEIAADPALVERIRQEAPHLLPEKIAAEADERLAADEKAAEEKQAAIDEKVAQQVFPEEVDPYFEVKESSGGGGSAAVVDTNVVTTWKQLIDKITEFNNGTANMTITLGANLPEDGADVESLPEIGMNPDTQEANGATLTLNLKDYALELPDPMENYSGLVITNIEGYIMMAGEPSAVIYNYDDLTLNDGTIVLSGIEGEAGVVNYGTFTMNNGGIRVGSLAMNNSGKYEFTQAENLENYSGTAIVNNGTVDFSGGTIEAGTGIENSSTLTMTGGTMNLTKPDTYGIVTHGDATLSGGTINISEDAVDEQGVGATGVIASGMLENTLVMNGTDVYAESGTAVSLDAGKITLAEGSQIHALNPTASAVMTAYGDNDALIVNRPVQAEVFAVTDIDPESEEFDPFDNTIFEPLYDDGMTLTSEDNGDGTYKVTLKDTYGQVSGWTAFVTAIEEFNDGEGDVTITLEESLDPIATENANVLERYPLPAIGDSNAPDTDKKLTIALGAYDLTLPSTLYNYNNLEITGTGEITASPDNVYSLIGNGGILTLNGPKLTVPHNVVGVDNMGTFNMAGGSMELIYTTGIQNNGGGIVNLNGGTITLVEDNDNYSEGGESPIGYLAYTTLGEGAVLNLNGTAINIAEGISYTGVGTDGEVYDSPPAAVYNETGSTVTMNSGTITVGSGKGIVNHGTLTITGGSVAVSKDGASAAYNSGTMAMTDGTLTADSTSGAVALLSAEYGTLTLTKGEITAKGNAWAIDYYGSADAIQIGADMVVRAEFSGDNVFKGTLPEGYGISALTGGYYYLEAEESDGITTWAQLVAAVDEFNALDGNGQTVTLTLGADIPAATETSLATMNPIASGNKHLVINLNNRGLTLPQTITVAGNLDIIGGGTISSTTVKGENTALFKVGSTGSLELNKNESGAPTIDLDANQTAISGTQAGIYMKAGKIQLGDVPSTAIYADGGSVEMSGGEIQIMACGDNWANMGIETKNNAIVEVKGGTISEGVGIKDATNDNNYAIYADSSTVKLTSGAISVHNGVAVYVSDTANLTLGSAVVTGKDAAKLLAVPEDVEETGFTTEAADTAGYSKLISTTPSNIIPVATADEIVRAFETVNSTETEYIIQMTADINMEPYEEGGQTVAYSPLTVEAGTETTLDLNGNELMLGNTLTNNGTLMITDGVRSGSIKGDADVLIDNKGDTTIESGTFYANNQNASGQAITSSAGTLTMNGGTIITDTQDGIKVSGGTFTMNGGSITTKAYNVAAVAVAGGEASLNGGTITVNSNGGGERGVSVSEGAALVMDGASIVVNGGSSSNAVNYGIYDLGGNVTITSGSITANDGADGLANAYAMYSTGWNVLNVDVDNADILAESETRVIDPVPAGYGVSTGTDANDYYYLTGAEDEEVPTEVNNWGEFVDAVADFNNGTEAATITLMADIDPSEEEVAAVEETYGVTLPAIGNGTSTDLTINLGGHTLGLPTTLATNSSSGLVITDDGSGMREGIITKGQEWDGSGYLINNYTELTQNGGMISVPHNVVGVNNMSTFNMENGSMELIYTTGIQNNGGIVNLNDGTITMVEDNNYANGGTDPIGYMAYATMGTDAVLNLNGTVINMPEGIYYFDGDTYDYCPVVGIYNEYGNTVTFDSGTITVGVNMGAGISNHGTLTMDGGTISVTNGGTGMELIDNDPANGVHATTTLNGGTVTAEEGSAAVLSGSAYVTVGANMNMKAKEREHVYYLADENFVLPAGYEVSDTRDSSGYYYLTAVSTPTTIEVATEEEFYKAVAAHTAADEDEMIVLENSLDFSDATPQGENNFVPANAAMNVVGDTRLTIDLAGNTLQLNSNVFSNTDELAITDSVGGGKILSNAWYIIDNNGTLLLKGGTLVMDEPVNYNTEGTPDKAAAIRNSASASFTMLGGAINVTGVDNDTSKCVYALYDEGGMVDIVGGTITAISGAGTVADGFGGNAYALYSAYTTTVTDENGELITEQTWRNLTIDIVAADIYANSQTTLLVPDLLSEFGDTKYIPRWEDDGYWHLYIPE